MRVEWVWVPNLQTMAVADDGREFLNIVNMEMEWIFRHPGFDSQGRLDRRGCKKLWRRLDRTDKVPQWLMLYMNSADMKRIFPKIDLDSPLE